MQDPPTTPDLGTLDLDDELYREPVRLVPPDPWVGHLPFAFWLVKALRPETFVELGTHSGNSYFGFCQAMELQASGGRAFAVDTWQGDTHAGAYDEDVYAAVAGFNNANFLQFSTLMRMTFDEARGYFPDGKIDLLHIDGLHTYEAVRHDFENWRSALSPRAVVVFHDINVRERNFGVWRLWGELAASSPHFAFDHSNGLGVLGYGAEQPPLLRSLFEMGRDRTAAAALRRRFSARGEAFQRRVQVLDREEVIGGLHRQLAGHAHASEQNRHAIAQLEETIHRLEDALAWREELLRGKDQLVAAKEAQLTMQHEWLLARDALLDARDGIIAQRDEALNALEQKRAIWESQAHSLEKHAAHLELARLHAEQHHARHIWQVQEDARLKRDAIEQMYERSTSWRLTGPVRAMLELVRPSAPRPADERLPEPPLPEEAFAEPAQAPPPDARAALRSLLSARLRTFLAGTGRLVLPDGTDPDVSIILVLHNQAELTYGCLGSIAECLGRSALRVQVILLDNQSGDATGALLDRVDNATIIRSRANLHFLLGVTQAAAVATGRHLLLLNNDAQLLPGTLEAAVRRLDDDATIGAVGGRIVLPDGTLQEAGSIIWRDGTCVGYGRGREPGEPEFMFRRDVDYCSGAFLLTPRAVWSRLSGFDDRYAPAYYEEVDYCVRLWRQGFRVAYDPDVVILHYEFGSAGSSEQALSLQRRNHAIFQARHHIWLSERQPAPGATATDAHMLAARAMSGARPRILMIEDRVPKVALGSGYPRSNRILRELADAGAEVTLFPMFAHEENWTEVRTEIDPAVEVMLDRDASRLRPFLDERRGFYDAILVCRPHNMQSLQDAVGSERARLGKAKIIYDAEAVFAGRDLLRAACAGEPVAEEEARRIVAREIALARGSDAVVSVSAAEQTVFQQHGFDTVYLLGHAERATPTVSDFHERTDFLFLGAIHDEVSPNADALHWFADQVLPSLRRLVGSDIRLKVVGMNRASSIDARDGVTLDLLGRVDDLGPVFERARVVVVPSRYAAGIPIKAQQTALLGVPMVVTELIAQQLGWEGDRDLLVASDAAGFAEACARLYTDAALWQRLRDAALGRARVECAPERFRTIVREIVGTIPIVHAAPSVPGAAPAPLPVRPPTSDQDPGFVGRPADRDYSVAVPFAYTPAPAARSPEPAIICHVFHMQVAEEMRAYLRNIPFAAPLFLSTDTAEKQAELARVFGDWDKGSVECRVFPNRGRDIAPKLVGFRSVYDRHDYVLHLHSKVSHHASFLAPWRGFLMEGLVGSSAIVRSVFAAFEHRPDLGMIFPQHFEPVRRWLDWSGNYRIARELAARMGITVTPDMTLDMPSGSMFWARSAALKPILDLDLQFEEFPEETGQTDHTLAHAIERLYLLACEHAGFAWLKIAQPDLYAETGTIQEIGSPAALDRFMAEHGVWLSGPARPPRSPVVPPMRTRPPPGLTRRLQSRQPSLAS